MLRIDNVSVLWYYNDSSYWHYDISMFQSFDVSVFRIAVVSSKRKDGLLKNRLHIIYIYMGWWGVNVYVYVYGNIHTEKGTSEEWKFRRGKLVGNENWGRVQVGSGSSGWVIWWGIKIEEGDKWGVEVPEGETGEEWKLRKGTDEERSSEKETGEEWKLRKETDEEWKWGMGNWRGAKVEDGNWGGGEYNWGGRVGGNKFICDFFEKKWGNKLSCCDYFISLHVKKVCQNGKLFGGEEGKSFPFWRTF